MYSKHNDVPIKMTITIWMTKWKKLWGGKAFSTCKRISILYSLTELIIANNVETFYLEYKFPNIAVTAFLILRNMGYAIAYSTNVGQGQVLSLPINEVTASSRDKFSNVLIILK